MGSDKARLLWDFSIQTDYEIQIRRPVIVFLDKEENQCLIVDIAVPGDARIAGKDKEKIAKYQDLKREITRLWNIKVYVVPVVVGALGIIPKNLKTTL